MEIIYDKQKDSVNKEKHGVTLALAHQMEWNNLIFYEDRRYD